MPLLELLRAPISHSGYAQEFLTLIVTVILEAQALMPHSGHVKGAAAHSLGMQTIIYYFSVQGYLKGLGNNMK